MAREEKTSSSLSLCTRNNDESIKDHGNFTNQPLVYKQTCSNTRGSYGTKTNDNIQRGNPPCNLNNKTIVSIPLPLSSASNDEQQKTV